ncbi:MAG: WD40 repeat domain-containing protein [Saprospiraceae bacterium]|nr:WD40 repeat domain-containing protein [Saprospiraceae bacterium]
MKNKYHFSALLLLLCLGNLTSQNLLWTQLAHPDSLQVNGVSFSVDGSQVLSGTNCHPSYLRIYDIADGSISWEFNAGAGLMCMMGVGFSSDGKYLASIEEFGNLLIFDLSQSTPTLLPGIVLGTDYAFSLAFSPNSETIAVGGSNGKLKTYKLADSSPELSINAHSSWVTTVAYSPDNALIATGGSDNKVKIWNADGTALFTLSGHTDDITSVEFTPDNARLVSSSKDNKLKIWNVADGTLIQTIDVSSANVNACDISPDGSLLASVSEDKNIRIWDMNGYALLSSFQQQHNARPLCVAWSPDGNSLATGTTNGLVTFMMFRWYRALTKRLAKA